MPAAGTGHLYECLGKSSHVDPQLAGDIASLNVLSDAQVKQVISFVVAFLQSPKVRAELVHFRTCTAPRLVHHRLMTLWQTRVLLLLSTE